MTSVRKKEGNNTDEMMIKYEKTHKQGRESLPPALTIEKNGKSLEIFKNFEFFRFFGRFPPESRF